LGGQEHLPIETRCIIDTSCIILDQLRNCHTGESTVRGCAITLPLPSPLPDPDPESESEPELSRVTVLIGGLQLDVGLPADISIAAVTDDVIEVANAQLATQPEPPDAEFDATAGKWTLAPLGGEPFDPHQSLAEFYLCDGEMLVIREVGTPCAPPLFDDLHVEDDLHGDRAASDPHRRREWAQDAPMVGCFAVGLTGSAATALLLVLGSLTMPAIAAVLALATFGVIIACVLSYGAVNARASPWLAAVALAPIFAGSLHIITGATKAQSLPIAFSLTGFTALVVLLASGRGHSFYTAVIALSILGSATTVSVLLWSPAPRTVGAILATVSVMVVYLAPRVTILLSKLPVPPVPTAGEPLDDIETEGGTTVEGVNAVGKQVIPSERGMIERVRPSNQYLTGIVVAATLAATVGSYLAIDVSHGFFWQGSVFVIAVATVLCLRGRSHYDLVQSATLIGGGLLGAAVLIIKTGADLDGWRANAALALVVLMMLIVATGLVAPRREFSPVMKRQVEILEYVAIAVLFPLCFWIIRLYAFFRELRI
jgi:type VII secretion integral membrane protein EccD